MNEEKNKFGIKSILFLIWFIASMLAAIILEKNGNYSVMILGQLFLGIGLLMPKEGVKINHFRLIFGYVGLLFLGIPFLMNLAKTYNVYDKYDWSLIIITIGISTFVLFGLGLMLIPKINKKRIAAICTETVKAVVIRHDSRWFGNRKDDTYCPVYEFEFNFKKYEVSYGFYSNKPEPEVGAEVELKIDPTNPYRFNIEEEEDKNTFLIGMIFFVPSLIGLIIFLSKVLF